MLNRICRDPTQGRRRCFSRRMTSFRTSIVTQADGRREMKKFGLSSYRCSSSACWAAVRVRSFTNKSWGSACCTAGSSATKAIKLMHDLRLFSSAFCSPVNTSRLTSSSATLSSPGPVSIHSLTEVSSMLMCTTRLLGAARRAKKLDHFHVARACSMPQKIWPKSASEVAPILGPENGRASVYNSIARLGFRARIPVPKLGTRTGAKMQILVEPAWAHSRFGLICGMAPSSWLPPGANDCRPGTCHG